MITLSSLSSLSSTSLSFNQTTEFKHIESSQLVCLSSSLHPIIHQIHATDIHRHAKIRPDTHKHASTRARIYTRVHLLYITVFSLFLSFPFFLFLYFFLSFSSFPLSFFFASFSLSLSLASLFFVCFF